MTLRVPEFIYGCLSKGLIGVLEFRVEGGGGLIRA